MKNNEKKTQKKEDTIFSDRDFDLLTDWAMELEMESTMEKAIKDGRITPLNG